MNPIRLTLVALTLALAAGFALAGKQPATAEDGALVGPSGMALYTFDKDAAGSGASACVGDCAKNWPPLPGPRRRGTTRWSPGTTAATSGPTRASRSTTGPRMPSRGTAPATG